MTDIPKCLLCNNSENIEVSTGTISCPICGKYQIEFNLLSDTDWVNLPIELRQKIRYKVKKNHLEQLKKTGLAKLGRQSVILTKEEIKNIDDSIQIPTMLEKIELVLDYIEENTTFISEKIYINPNTYFPIFFCKNNYELQQILQHLSDTKLINRNDSLKVESTEAEIHDVPTRELTDYIYNYYIDTRTKYQDGRLTVPLKKYSNCFASLTNDGLRYQDKKRKNCLNSKQCFVAMWFDDSMENIYKNYIKPAIENSDGKFNAIKINDVDHTNDINDEIIAQIKKSRFMVVDLTGYRGGVYFEAGFGFGLGLPVIYTCRKDCLERKVDDKGNVQEGVHFDINHRNMLLWTNDINDSEYDKYNLEKFKKNLTNRINAIV